MTDEPSSKLSWRKIVVALAGSLAAGIVFVLTPYASVWLFHLATDGGVGFRPPSPGFNFALVALYPVVQGFVLGLLIGPKRGLSEVGWLICALFAIEVLCAVVIVHEGAICLIIASPLIFGFMLAGALLGRWLAQPRSSRALRVSLVPLMALAVFGEALGPKPDFANVVVDSVTVDAPPDYVWRYVVDYPENQAPPEYWLWRLGLPTPIQSVAEAPRVGATRLCRFTDGIVFEERITELRPNEVMTFDVTKQPDHPEVTGHFQFDRGQIRLTRNSDGSTTITATSWYRLFVRPAAYFDWWTADIARNVHFRVLNHIGALAERDYRRDMAAQPVANSP